MIIGVTGTLGAGKSTIADYLVKNKGFKHFSMRDVINKEIEKRALPINRDNMIAVANDLRAKHGPGHIAEKLFEIARKSGGDCVLESLRTVGEIEALKEKGEFILIAVDANQELRYGRVQKRKNIQSDDINFEKFKEQEDKEMKSEDPAKQNLSKCISMADYVLKNDSSLEEFYALIEKVLNEVKI